MMDCMADFSHILTTRPDFDDEDREWLHHLVADWQVIADLSFADLLLILQNGEGKYIIAEQCRPSTVMSLITDDVVGDVVEEGMRAELDAAMAPSRCSVPRCFARWVGPRYATYMRRYATTARLWVWWYVKPTWPPESRMDVTNPKVSARASSCMR